MQKKPCCYWLRPTISLHRRLWMLTYRSPTDFARVSLNFCSREINRLDRRIPTDFVPMNQQRCFLSQQGTSVIAPVAQE